MESHLKTEDNRQMEVMLLSELKKGMQFPEYQYTLSEDIIKKYVEGTEENGPLYVDEDFARNGPFGYRIVPPTSIAIYVTPSQIFKTIGKKPPPGTIQTTQRFEFYSPIRIGETVTVRASVEDIYQKKGRDYFVIRAEAFNNKGNRAAVSCVTGVWPRSTEK